MHYEDFFTDRIKDLKEEGRYRVFIDLKRKRGAYPLAEYRGTHVKREVTVWCSNDYLGMGQNPYVIEAMKNALDETGAGSGGTRNISGTTAYHVDLEREIADLHNKEAALLFTSGYVSNSAALSALGAHLPDCHIFSDEKNHASMIEGIRFAKCERRIFKHNNLKDLTRLLAETPTQAAKIIAVESVYSMDGSLAPLSDLACISKEYNALLYVDEVHAVGLYGPTGGGMTEAAGVQNDVHFIEGTLAKGFGVAGGYVAASKNAVDFIRSYAPGFIFTTSIPPVLAAGALAAVRYARAHREERQKLHERSDLLKRRLSEKGFPVIPSMTHIVPLLVGDPVICKNIADILLTAHGHYVQPINYPTVPRGAERLRFTPGPHHTDEMIESLVSALVDIRSRIGREAFHCPEAQALYNIVSAEEKAAQHLNAI